MVKRKLLNAILAIFLFADIVILSIYYYGWSIYTYVWHIASPNTTKLNGVSIVIPDTLVSETIIDKNGAIKLHIYRAGQASYTSIFVALDNCQYIADSRLYDIYSESGYTILRIEYTKVLNTTCLKVTSTSSNDRSYREDIFFGSKAMRISFIGDARNRYYLEQVLDGLRST